jgi:hypothetical protein
MDVLAKLFGKFEPYYKKFATLAWKSVHFYSEIIDLLSGQANW